MPTFLKLLNLPRRMLKAFTLIFQTGAGTLSAVLNRTQFNYAATDPLRNSAVVAVVNWIARNFPEAPILVRKQTTEHDWEVNRKHPLVALLKRPNPYHSGNLLQMALIIDFVTAGNAYLVKVRSAAGRVVQLWWSPAGLIEPKDSSSDGSGFITHYDYSPRGVPIRLEPTDVIHLRLGLDPSNPRKGLSPLASLLREVFTDDEASNFTASLLRNLGVPGVIMAPKEGMAVNPEDLAAAKAKFRETFGGDNRGDVMMMTAPTDVHVLSFSPEQMNLRSLRQIPEERISGVFGVAAIVAGLGAGLSRSTFSNFQEAREASYEENIIPMQRIIAAELTSQLLTDFESSIEGMEVFYDLSEVRVLREDEDAASRRLVAEFMGGIRTRAEARRKLGLATTREDEVYSVPVSVMLIGPGAPEEPLPALSPPKSSSNGVEDDRRILDYIPPFRK